MHRFLVRTLASAIIVAATLSCAARDGIAPAGRVATIAIAPRFQTIVRAAETAPLAINRVRLIAKSVADGTVLATRTQTVVSTDEEWQIDFPIQLPDEGEVSVVVTVELINFAGGVEAVQWSGITAPFTLTTGPIGAPVDVPVVRGPLANLGVTAVTISPTAPSVVEGATTTLNATPSGGGAGAVVYWTSLDPAVATVSDAGVVTGIVPGTARIVATVGSRTDTVTVTVAVKVQTITVAPPSATLSSIGATATYTAKAFDPRGAQINNITIALSVAPSTVAAHDGNGVMRAVGNGTATVSGTAQGVTGTATLTVQQVATTVVISGNTTIVSVPGTAALSALAKDANGNTVSGAAITWETSASGVATVNQSGVVTAVSVGSTTITARVSATVFGTVSVTVGNPVFFTNGFETGDAAWTTTGVATATGVAGASNQLFGTHVTGSSALSPAAAQGTRYGWLASPSSGNYIGTQIPGDPPLSGGTSTAPTGGALSSPTFTVPAGVNTGFLSFRSWFEIEGISPESFDLMVFEVVDANNGAVLATGGLNSSLSGTDFDEAPTTSAGPNASPVFVLISSQVNGIAGRTLRIRFTFNTVDVQYNGFRGWIVDDVRFSANPPAALFAPGSAVQVIKPMCEGDACARLVPPVVRRRQ